MSDRLNGDVSEKPRNDKGANQEHLLATLAHELRTPLSPIKNALELMQLAELDPDRLEHLRSLMLRQVDQMVRLIDNVLDASRMSRGAIAIQRDVVNVQSALRTAIEAVRPFAEESRHSLLLDIPTRPLTVRGDAVRISQIVINLLNNAAKYTPPGGRIELSVERDHDQVVIRVRDNGIGIPKDKQAEIFELFVQADTGRERGQTGLGIGLTLAKTLVEMHDGSIWVESDGPGTGSLFTVRLPLCEESQSLTDTVIEGPHFRRALMSFRVLIVDDSHADRFVLSRLLETMGHTAAVADDGREALRIVPAFRPEVIISDVSMPHMNGLQLAERIRADRSLSRILLVALTGYGQESDRRRAMMSGFDLHLTKPVGVSDLDAVFEQLSQHSTDPHMKSRR